MLICKYAFVENATENCSAKRRKLLDLMATNVLLFLDFVLVVVLGVVVVVVVIFSK